MMSDNNQSDALFRQLAAEEPPIQNEEDTLASATAPTQPFAIGGNMNQQFIAGFILLMALVFTMAAALLTLMGEEDSPEAQAPAPVINNDNPVATMTEISATQTPLPTEVVSEVAADTSNPLPTAAIDEASIALLNPILDTNVNAVIERVNPPFTQRTGDSSVSTSNTEVVQYVVQTGDTLDAIKQEFQLEDLCSIIWANDRNKVSPLRPGVAINVPPVDGYYARVRDPISIAALAEEAGVAPESIINSIYNPMLEGAMPENLIPEGASIMIPGGNGGNCNIWAAANPADPNAPTASSGNILSYIQFYGLLGCDVTVTPGSFPVNVPYSGSFWQGFSAAHSGIDLSGNTGDPVFAAGGGTVIFSGWNDFGYGNTVAIAHGTTFSIYAHLSSTAVSCGQQVGSLQTIGYIGSTGNSSGPHLHFEIRNASFDALDPCNTISC